MMAIINATRKTSNSIIEEILNSKKFLVRVPTASIMTIDELRIKGMDVNNDVYDLRNLNIKTEIEMYKEKKAKKKKYLKRDTTFDDVVLDSSGDALGTMTTTELKHFVNRRRKYRISKKDKIVENKTEIYLTISKLLEISKDGFTIKLLNVNDLKIIYELINKTIDKIENSLNVSNTILEKELKEFLEELTNLNKTKLTNDFKQKDNNIMDDMFGTDIFMTSPSPVVKKYNMKDIKV
jgi:hypothetical protein